MVESIHLFLILQGPHEEEENSPFFPPGFQSVNANPHVPLFLNITHHNLLLSFSFKFFHPYINGIQGLQGPGIADIRQALSDHANEIGLIHAHM